jgi:hypothetical protein
MQFHYRLIDLMLLDWVSFLAYPNLFGIKGFVVVVVVHYRLILYQGPSKFYTICNGYNLTVFDGLSDDNEIA